jgi:BolA protein
MIIRQRMETKLREALQPERLDVIDESHRHAGHGGAHPEGESHFRIHIVSAAFSGKSRVARQRLVYDALAEELRERVHALSLETLSPEEAGSAAGS